jgi:hypothetical protein
MGAYLEQPSEKNGLTGGNRGNGEFSRSKNMLLAPKASDKGHAILFHPSEPLLSLLTPVQFHFRL